MKICNIIPYFGQFPSYFQLFLFSCGNNPEINWLIITDNQQKYKYPGNVEVIHMTFSELKQLVQTKFDFPVSLERPYKLCDYKPAYGYIFSTFIRDYDWWGHCDVDVIWGDLKKILTEEKLAGYDKAFDLGHFTLYRNTVENNERFKLPYEGKYLYRSVFSTDKSCIFDELYKQSINNIFAFHGYDILTENISADIYTKSSNFLLTYQNANHSKYLVEKKADAVFVYDNGKLYRYVKNGHEIQRREYAYIHLQKRPMKNMLSSEETQRFLIIPNAFEELNNPVSLTNWKKIKKKNFNLHYFRIRYKNLKTKIKHALRKR